MNAILNKRHSWGHYTPYFSESIYPELYKILTQELGGELFFTKGGIGKKVFVYGGSVETDKAKKAIRRWKANNKPAKEPMSMSDMITAEFFNHQRKHNLQW
jgi:hypothetical protein